MGFLNFGTAHELIQLKILIIGTRRPYDTTDLSSSWTLDVEVSERGTDGVYHKRKDSGHSVIFTDPRLDVASNLASQEDLRDYMDTIVDTGARNDPEKFFKRYRTQDFIYAKKLLERTGLMRSLASCLSGRDHSNLSIALDVRSNSIKQDSCAPHKYPSLHTIQWEILEDSRCWNCLDAPFCVQDITVRRLVTPTNDRLHCAFRDPKVSTDTIDILLVIARMTSEHAVDKKWNPTTVLRGLLTQQRHLQLEHGARHRIHLEVVRPGSLKELRKHLEYFQKVNGKQFDAIHFDMHGDIIKTPQRDYAVLTFNSWERTRLTDQQEETQDIADLLVKYGIPTALFGSCKSASAEFDHPANFALSLVERGVQNVLAMSFNMADTMGMDFFRSFYHTLLWENKSLSASARIARCALRSEPTRFSSFRGENIPVNDWFVPVVYSTGEDFKLEEIQSTQASSLGDFKPGWLIGTWLLARNQCWVRSIIFGACVFFLALLTTLQLCHRLTHVFTYAAIDFTPDLPTLSWCDRGLGAVTQASLQAAGIFALVILIVDLSYWSQQARYFSESLAQIENDQRNFLRIEAAIRCHRLVFVHGRPYKEYLQAFRFIRSLFCIWRRTNAADDFEIFDCAWFKPSLSSCLRRIWHRARHHISFMEDNWVGRSISRRLHDNNENHPGENGSELVGRRKILLVTNLHLLWPEDATSADLEAQNNLKSWVEQLLRHISSEPDFYVVILGERVGTGTGDDDWFAKLCATEIESLKGSLQEPYNVNLEPQGVLGDPRTSVDQIKIGHSA